MLCRGDHATGIPIEQISFRGCNGRAQVPVKVKVRVWHKIPNEANLLCGVRMEEVEHFV